jgi:hypothetical protein
MARRTTTYTRDELNRRHPALVEALDQLIKSDRKKFQSFYVNYCGKYTRQDGTKRRIQLGQAIEILEENGYGVDIRVSK